MPKAKPFKSVEDDLERYNLKERLLQTDRAAKVLRAALKSKSYKRQLRPLKVHDPQQRLRNLQELMKVGMKKSFPSVYRGLLDAHDEFVRTSMVTDLLLRLLNSNFSPAEMKNLSKFITELSLHRLPTKWSGFKFKNPKNKIRDFSAMQHPTSKGTGIWDRNIGGGSSAHTALDEARFKVAIDAINSFVLKDANGVIQLKPGTTIERIANELLVKVGTFTFNRFTAPASADNLDADATKAEKLRQTQAREYWKDRLEQLGAKRYQPPPGIVIPRLNLPTRDWRPDLMAEGEISPRRGPVITFKKMDAIMGVEVAGV